MILRRDHQENIRTPHLKQSLYSPPNPNRYPEGGFQDLRDARTSVISSIVTVGVGACCDTLHCTSSGFRIAYKALTHQYAYALAHKASADNFFYR